MDVAVIGIACRFPGANDHHTFWTNLVERKASISVVPSDRWDWAAYWGDPRTEINKSLSKWGGFIERVDAFDNQFFGVLPKVAQTMDPQQRIMLELTWSCLEDAGIAPAQLRGSKVGVIVGVFNHDYKELQERDEASIEAHHSTGTATAVIANRVSHYFDFRGPSIPIDTACSSSLNAIHSAIQAMEYGDCEMALAGGINLLLTPTRHISFSKMGMLSPTGTCKTFDDSADGYVRGEGAGLLLLKPLDKALADGDSIYGVIKGSAVNHCGETYTLTYPSPRAQSEVIVAAHERAGIPIDSVGFVEAHGTGTPKGDPIEFEGLLTAFRTLADKQSVDLGDAFCGISSVKTNIGHLEAAAGVAGAIKVLMAFKHRTLPALHNFTTLNSKIAIDGTPFYMLDDTREWKHDAADQPRRAGVSSFGFGGTNAHIVLEEAPRPRKAMPARPKRPAHLIALSAKTGTALLQKQQDLLAWLQADAGQSDLLDISATLLTGRNHFQHRFACVAASVQELIGQLEQALAEPVESISKEREPVAADAIEAGKKWLAQLGAKSGLKGAKGLDALQRLADLYVAGADLRWAVLFEKIALQRLALPTYPFSRDSFWISESEASTHDEGLFALHPVLQRNVSTLGTQRYASTFSGKEFFLADHIVRTQPVLPGVVYLEMVHAAVADAVDVGEGTVQLSDIVWMRPLEVSGAPASVQVELRDEAAAGERSARNLSFQVVNAEAGSAAQIYCRGRATVQTGVSPLAVDVTTLMQACDGPVYSAEECYRSFARQGLNYGAAQQAISLFRSGTHQCLAELTLPEALAASSQPYVIHPSTADAALQAAVAFVAGIETGADTGASATTFLPFTLERIEVYGRCTSAMHAWVRYSPGRPASESTSKVDIDVIDSSGSGRVCLAFRGLSVRPLNTGASHTAATHMAPSAVATEVASLPAGLRESLYTPAWISQPAHGETSASPIDHLLVVGEQDDAMWLMEQLRSTSHFASTRIEALCFAPEDAPDHVATTLQAKPGHLEDYEAAIAVLSAKGIKLDRVVLIAPRVIALDEVDGLESRVGKSAQNAFALIKAMMRGTKSARFVQLVSRAPQRPEYQGLSGFYKTLRIEKPSYVGRVVQCDMTDLSAQQLADIVASEFSENGKDIDISYTGPQRSVRKFRPLGAHGLSASAPASLRKQGVYLITGGMGALGLIFARHLCVNYQAKVFLTGRSRLTEQHQRALDELSALGGHASFLTCDVASHEDVRCALAGIRAAGHQLNGVIHSAGVIEDGFILRKSPESFARVMTPKTLGTWYLDLETREDPLDFFALFSSVTGVLGNIGQCDYGFGNAFEDYFAHQRETLRECSLRNGKTLSINWPYWKEGGMRLTDKEEEILQRSFGIVPLLSQQGIEVFEYGLTQAASQLVVMPGDAAKVHEVLGVDAAPAIAVVAAQPAASQRSPQHAGEASIDLSAVVSRYLAELFAEHLQIPADFEADRSFRDYGFDSVVMIDLIHLMEKTFGSLPMTLFFEHSTLGELTAFFVEHYPEPCRAMAPQTAALVAASESTLATEPVSYAQDGLDNAQHVAAKAAFASSVRSAPIARDGTGPGSVASDDIAIIGLSGRYPQAENLAQFWENLKFGRDCVVEIPPDRWDIESSFAPGAAAPGKTYSKWGGFLKGVDQFDPLFFHISPKEAENMDPNERLFLETAALTIEDAGYTPDKLVQARGVHENPVGVFVGVMWGDYQLHGVEGPSHTWASPHSFYWAVANRVSHYFNFSGPSITVDTACSSSLTAIHLACAAIRNGEIGVAMAGAVNLSLHLNKYSLLSDMRFLSTDGRCRSFGEGGDGYVPGEGVGAVLLKSLAQARADGDHIYGIIRGTAVNHGGKTSGFTVPNSRRQAALIQDALQTADVNPRHISYLEAHGTGTSLGDPIEISGLNRAFAQQQAQYCAIGSVKSNIGHLEAAAGMAGLTKVLLQMKHRTLVPSIQSDKLNPYIDFQKSPFYVQRTLQDWQRPSLDVIDPSGATRRVELPRLAGISSFGAGGSNAHLVVEEYVEPVRSDEAEGGRAALIVLSAKKEVALKAMAGNLADFIEANPGLSLHDAAYTLQIGRVPMEHRLAVVATQAAEAIAALRAYPVDSGSDHAGLFVGHREQAKTAASVPPVAEWVAQRHLPQIAVAWVSGHAVEWERLHHPQARQRVSLPGYVYQRQRYWIAKTTGAAYSTSLHPLIDTNVSTLDEQTFRKTFRPDEFFLRDHQLGSNRILPGVAHMEMALAAGQLAHAQGSVRALRDVQWLKPVLVNDANAAFDIGLIPDADGIHFEIYQAQGDSRLIYSQGVLELDADDAAPPATVDLPSVVARCRMQGRDAIADAFTQMGFHFGPSFQVFDALHFNEHEALAKLSLPVDADAAASHAFTLSPSLLDGAVRTALGVGGLGAESNGVQVPVRLSRIEVFGPVNGACYAYARRVDTDTDSAGQRHYDIDVVDPSGRVLVRLERFTIQSAPQLGMMIRSSGNGVAAAVTQTPALAKTQALPPVSTSQPTANSSVSNETMYQAIVAYLIELLSKVTKVPTGQIDPKSALENYGIDSVMILTLTEKLHTTFGEVPKTLFFEYQDLHSLSEYFLDSHAEQVRDLAAALSPRHVVAQELSAEAKAEVEARARIRARLFARLQETLGDQAKHFSETTPLVEWPIDPVDHARLLHVLRQEFEAIEADAVYRYATLDDWAAAIQAPSAKRIDDSTVASASVGNESTRADESSMQTDATPLVTRRSSGASPASRFAYKAANAAAEDQDIAIIGVSGRYPGARNLDEFWQNLSAGKDGISEIPLSRWDHEPHFRPDRQAKGHVYSKWGGFIDDIDQFDASFFSISPREAETTDPQERLFLQTAWECLEDACYTRQSLKEREVGVFVGAMWGHYESIEISEEQRQYGRPMALFSSIANRVSYFLNLSGPSVALDTMCSSSLTALHLACQAIRNGDCQMAIAGGVNLIVHPVKYHLLSQAQFLSTDGRCRAFGDGGDGYVPGEGVGAVLLKPLRQAIEDGDQIHGVVKATAINHGGKTNGYTVPNQVAQGNVIGKALRRAGWHPGSIDYIEAHGTGTSLGDPIEIAGLSKAFHTVAQDAEKSMRDGQGPVALQSCRMGSVKSNIGHLESAAGIAALTKVLLQLRHRSIAPSLHSSTLNANIDFAKTPFRVVQALERWDAPTRPGIGGLRAARRAGISSFGAGGSNAHVLIEEYPVAATVQPLSAPVLFVLSADSEERLELYIDRVLVFLVAHRHDGSTLDLRSLAYSSLIGREAMNERLAVVTSSLDDLIDALTQYRKGVAVNNLQRGAVKKHNEKLEAILDDTQRDGMIRSLLQVNRLPQLAKAWVSMLDIEWERYTELLFASDTASPQRKAAIPRMSFPVMPFLTKRHWVQEKPAAADTPHLDALHPLLDRNVSTLTQQSYAKQLTGREFYLRDHIVDTGEKRVILPGVAYLEMARAAGELALGDAWQVDGIRNLIWIQPVEIKGAPEEVAVTLTQADDAVEFEIVRTSSQDVSVEGELHYRHADDVVEDEWIDLAALRAHSVIEEQLPEIYDAFQRMGFHYGSSYQVTQTRYRMPGGALSHLKLPESLHQDAAAFVLHPSLFDGALRTCLATGVASMDATTPIVPFALGELEIRHALTEECYAYATEVVDDEPSVDVHGTAVAGTGLRKYNIVVTDGDGRVLIKLWDFSARSFVKAEPQPSRTLQYFSYDWLDTPQPPSMPSTLAGRTLLVIAEDAALAEALSQRMGAAVKVVLAQTGTAFEALDDTHCRFDPSSADSYIALMTHLADRGAQPSGIVHYLCDGQDFASAVDREDLPGVHRGILSMRHLFNALERAMPGQGVRCAYVHEALRESLQPQHDAISGYAKSLLTLNHRFELFTLRTDQPEAVQLAAALQGELDASGVLTGHEIAHWGGRRYVRNLLNFAPAWAAPGTAGLGFKSRGVYLITGGAGKLGLIFARYLAKNYQARLILTGRSEKLRDDALEALDSLRRDGADVHYLSADIAVAGQADALLAFAKDSYGALDGILHCAGVGGDTPITQLDDAAFHELLAPKIDGLLALDSATQNEPLDLFVNFSSVSAMLGDLGSGAYAVANRFMDSHALWREARRKQGQRSGKTLSIGWPLWATGGMEISPQDATLFGFSGMSALTEDEGVEAFERLLRGETVQVLVAVGDAAKIARTLRVHGAASPQVEAVSASKSAPTAVAPSRVAATPRAVAVKTAPVPPVSQRDSAAASPANTTADLQRRTEHYLKERLGVVVKMTATDIGAQTTFEQLGMDSVMLMELRDGLSKDFAGLPKTVLFEYDTPLRLAQYLIQQHADALRTRLGSVEPVVADATPATSSAKAVPAAVSLPAVSVSKTSSSVAASTVLPVSGKRRPAISPLPPVADNAVAIIGVAGQFPGAADLAEFWSNLQQAKDCLSPIPAERWTVSTAQAGTRDGRRNYFSKGGFLSDVDQFDPALFRMSPTEAAKLDPQLRVLLRAAWHAVEDAAYTPETLSPERVGVYVGAMNEDFTWIMSELYARTGEYPGPGSVISELANRISFLMNFQGPSLTVSTACSSSLTAVHLARQSILSGESDVALAGGVNLSLHPSKYLMLQDMKVLSPDGQERTFDEAANGLVPSEGVGMVMLKRLSRALADGDQIYGVIRGSSISHAGTGAGQYLPNLKMLEDTVARSLRESGLQADELSYIESHGTGTELGDPIELKALANALRQSTATERFCAIGTKANLGHMEAASGVCSLIKVLLSMKHGRLSPCAKLNAVNSSFEHEFSPFHFPREAQPWQVNARGTRAAGINSFGMGGSNAFMVLESLLPETSARRPSATQAEPSIVVLSAKSEDRLRAYTAALVDFLGHAERQSWSAADFADLAYSSQVGRIAFEHRLAIVASERKEFIAKAGKYLQTGPVADLGIFSGHARAQDGLPDLLDGDAGKDFIDALLQSRQWDKLASIWTRGCVIDWVRMHAGARRRVPFPAYPFDTLRCDLHEAIGMQAPRQNTGVATEAIEHAAPGDELQMSHEWFHLDASSAELAQAADDVTGDGDELAKQYWLDHLRGFADTSFLLAPVLLPEYAVEEGEPENHAELPAHSVTDSLGEAVTQALQRCTQLHRIEVETLIAAAWAILVNRYTKARCAQFGILKSFTPTPGAAMAEDALGDDAIRNLVPVRVCTVGKDKVAGWLTGLQRKLNHKLAYAHVPIQRIESWIGVENLFDSVIAFENSGQPQAAAQPATGETRPLLASEVFSPQSRVAMELLVTIHTDAVELNLIYRSAEVEDEKIRTLLEHFQVLLEGLAAHPEKNPAALAMRTKRESRETFWKTLDKVNQ